ncbi:DUF2971 domain-containing protein [Lysobacter koreensis]|uniref:DUF2971 domain-containing protein n=1 Tax=Lysobacter koreensis TaxID=266122 RepID=A0ABW2YMQ4_9GAMM
MDTPSHLYKYTSADTAKVVLSTGCLRWSSPEIFNDPAEFRRLPSFEPSLVDSIPQVPRLVVAAAAGDSTIDVERLCAPTRQLYDLVSWAISQGMKAEDFLDEHEEDRALDAIYHERLREFFGENFTKQARVLCLTANPLNPAMWANYAQSHAGCLLGFKHLPELSTPLQEAKRVTYHETAPLIGSGLDFLLYGDSKELRERTIDYICFAKKAEWQYEQEWRVITWRSNEGHSLHGDYPFFPDELESLTFGLRASDDDVNDLTALTRSKYPACSVFRVVSEHGELKRVRA